MSDVTEKSPSAAQIRRLVAALKQFVYAFDYGHRQSAWQQENYYLPRFMRVAKSLAPLRNFEGNAVGWPIWFDDWIPGIIEAFDAIAESWGWGWLLKPSAERRVLLKERDVRFRDSYLPPIQDAAKKCLGLYHWSERPSEVERLAENVPPLNFEFPQSIFSSERLSPLSAAIQDLWKSYRIGIRYPLLFKTDQLSEEYHPAGGHSGLLKRAYTKIQDVLIEYRLDEEYLTREKQRIRREQRQARESTTSPVVGSDSNAPIGIQAGKAVRLVVTVRPHESIQLDQSAGIAPISNSITLPPPSSPRQTDRLLVPAIGATKPKPCECKAGQSYEYAIEQTPELKDALLKDIHDWLRNNECPYYPDDDLPGFGSWVRYLRTYERIHGRPSRYAKLKGSGPGQRVIRRRTR